MNNTYTEQNYGLHDKLVSKQFELPGSKIHDSAIYPFKIEHMFLRICPNFSKMVLQDCDQFITIKALRDISQIVLDIYELKINKIESATLGISKFMESQDHTLTIEFSRVLKEGETSNFSINYSAGFDRTTENGNYGAPKNGFHFITKHTEENQTTAYQAWTQGEATESRYWFPCIDSPQMKFTLEIEVTAPSEFLVISNGLLESKKIVNDTTIWKYTESTPLAAYLVSTVIGEFNVYVSKYKELPLYYNWPKDINQNDALLTFSETPLMIGFFEEYFGKPYPFQKYSQTAVDNFEFGGMENSSCTTITRNVFHDDSLSMEYHNDILLVVHELAHQWFGNLVTCKDWSHIWLNEGFATYGELLYWEKSRGRDEFHFNLIKYSDSYFEESNDEYIRPIVTKLYKHPDELFDAHSYEKASIIIHMIRNHIGDENFRKSVKGFLDEYHGGPVDTLDLLNKIEQASGIEMHSFFDQWIFRAGHPELFVEYELHLNSEKSGVKKKTLTIKVIQKTDKLYSGESKLPYNFQMEFLIRWMDEKSKDNQMVHLVKVDDCISETKVEFTENTKINSISIDPSFKILKEIKSVKVTNESAEFQTKDLIIRQIKNGETIVEQINAIRSLKKLYIKEVAFELGQIIISDSFYGVAIEAANTLGSYYDKNNYDKSNVAYEILISICKNQTLFDKLRPEIKRAIVKNIGNFEREESIERLEDFIDPQRSENVFVMSAAATSIGKSSKKSTVPPHIKKKILSKLINLVTSSHSFQSVLGTAALEGLKEISDEAEEEIYLQSAQIILDSTEDSKDYFIRAKATTCLSKFLRSKIHHNNPRITIIHNLVFSKLKELVKNDRRRIKMNACEALSDESAKFLDFPDSYTVESLQVLIEVARTDIDGFARRIAEVGANSIKDGIADWAKKPLTIESESDKGKKNE